MPPSQAPVGLRHSHGSALARQSALRRLLQAPSGVPGEGPQKFPFGEARRQYSPAGQSPWTPHWAGTPAAPANAVSPARPEACEWALPPSASGGEPPFSVLLLNAPPFPLKLTGHPGWLHGGVWAPAWAALPAFAMLPPPEGSVGCPVLPEGVVKLPAAPPDVANGVPSMTGSRSQPNPEITMPRISKVELRMSASTPQICLLARENRIPHTLPDLRDLPILDLAKHRNVRLTARGKRFVLLGNGAGRRGAQAGAPG